MPLERVISTIKNSCYSVFNSSYGLALIFTLLFVGTRMPYLGPDSINPDAVNWHYRSEQFIVGLKHHQWERTYQHYHPGVTLMWIIGSVVEVARQINPALRIYTHENFLLLHTLSKYALVFVQLALSLFLMALLGKVFSKTKAFLIVTFFSLEPFFIGNSRLLHLDVLLTLFLMIFLTMAFLSGSKEYPIKLRRKYLFFSGVFLGFSFLTKSISIGGLPFIFAFLFFTYKRDFKEILLQFIFFLLGFFGIVFIFFPATWVSPVQTLTRIFMEAERVGIRKGHDQIFFGSYTIDPGVAFYPVIFFLKTSPMLLIGFFLFLKNVFKKTNSFVFLSATFYLGYMGAMTFSSKKIDRYIIPVFPLLAIFSLFGYENVLPKKYQKPVFALYICLLLGFNFAFHPYQFTYTTPLVGSAKNAHAIVAQKPFGIGIPALKEKILSNYGDYPKIGFYDIKPMGRIYPSSRIFDLREYGPSNYDIVVLGPNEEPPDYLEEVPSEFILDDIMVINGLDYWRIYVKKDFFAK